MTSMIDLPEWAILGVTAEDYQAMPEDLCRRIEIVDGAVVFQPNPGLQHQHVVGGLTTALRKACDPGWAAVHRVDLRLRDAPLLNRCPDIVIYDSSLPDDEVLRPQHCLLLVEVMTAHGSVTTDRHDKPAEYAAAGIEHFWRAEIDDEERLTVFRYRLSPMTKTYASAGAHTDKLVVTDPLRVSIDLGELL